MLKTVTINKYKCFKDESSVEIAPLTILCGTNSSGKSSIIKSILTMKQTVESKSPDASVALSGELVDNGTFRDAVYAGEGQEFEIADDFEIKNPKLSSTGVYIKRQDAKAFNELRRIYYSDGVVIKNFIVKLRVRVKKQSQRGNKFVQYITDNKVDEYSIYFTAYDENNEIIENCSSWICFQNRDNNEEHLLSWKNVPGYAKAATSWKNYKCTCSFNGLVITSVFAYNMPNNVKSAIPNILTLVKVAFSQYEGINFIAPLRQTPRRTYLIQGNVRSVGVNGEHTPVLLAKLKDQILTNDFRFMKKDKAISKNRYAEVVQYWLDKFQIGTLKFGGSKGTISLTLDGYNLSDVGFGASQILPIITQGVFMNKEETLIIEQPEIHLHPKMELTMADFLIELARSERNVIVETHSDHIINRVVHRVMENYDELSEIVKIYFVEKTENGGVIHPPISIDKYKGTRIEYKDFFTQYTSESKEIISTGIKNALEKEK